MTADFEPVLTRHVGTPGSRTIDFWTAQGGYEAVRRVLKETRPEDVIETVKASNLRGRGGAGFPTGLKWSFVPKGSPKPKYLVVNADESEPGTFKDRVILEQVPHLLLEGIIISAYAIGCHTAYIYIRGEFYDGYICLEEAIAEAYAKGYLGRDILGSGFDLDLTVHRGAGAYICGEETGLLSSLEGKRGYPKIKPPFPAVEGAFGCPTVVNNVETLACVPSIFERGADWFRAIGPEKAPGPKLYCISGHVNRPGVYELPMGMRLPELIDKYGGGVWKGRKLKAVIPGGASAPVLTPAEVDLCMDFDSCAKAGTMLGSAGIVVLDETTCMVDALWNILRFFHHESCGQCTPCREGTGWLEKVLERLEKGHGKPDDLQLLDDICTQMVGKTICVLADAAAMPTQSYVKKFRDEFEDHIREGCCTVRRAGRAGHALAGRAGQHATAAAGGRA